LLSLDDVFRTVIYEYKAEADNGTLTPTAFKLWLSTLEPISIVGNEVTLQTNSKFSADLIIENYKDDIEKKLERHFGFPVDVIITHIEQVMKDDGRDPVVKKKELEKKMKSAEYEYTFDTFIVGSSNKFAYAASRSVAEEPATAYNPLFIHGPSGLGKTHLMTAIANYLQENNPEMNVLYVTGEAFANELILAIQQKRDTSGFHDKYRTADVLLVDDVQFIAGKDATQEEFFHTFNELKKLNRQIVLTSDRPPKEIKTLEDRIKTRFEQGLIADISIPEYETRVAILKRKAELLDLNISPGLVEMIAIALKANIRQLEGCVKKLKAIEHLVGTPPTLSQAQAAIREVLSDETAVPVTIPKIIAEVATVYGVSTEDIISTKRSSNVSLARQVCCYVIKEATNLSYKTIGLEIGGRDHSTVVYYVDKIRQKMEENQHTKELITDMLRNLNA
jgi:chromosomal replication initiator protein